MSCRAVQLAEAALKGGRSSGGGGTEVQEAAVAVLAGAINAHPNLHSGHLLLIGQAMLAPAEAGQEQPPAQPADSAAPAAAAAGAEPALQHAEAPRQQLPLAAAAAYCRLLLHNKLKLQGMLGCLGAALVASPGPVAAIVSRALRQLLGGAAPKERARLAMALFHQAPADCRRHLAQVAPLWLPRHARTACS